MANTAAEPIDSGAQGKLRQGGKGEGTHGATITPKQANDSRRWRDGGKVPEAEVAIFSLYDCNAATEVSGVKCRKNIVYEKNGCA